MVPQLCSIPWLPSGPAWLPRMLDLHMDNLIWQGRLDMRLCWDVQGGDNYSYEDEVHQ